MNTEQHRIGAQDSVNEIGLCGRINGEVRVPILFEAKSGGNRHLFIGPKLIGKPEVDRRKSQPRGDYGQRGQQGDLQPFVDGGQKDLFWSD